jgi:hypothetical protein
MNQAPVVNYTNYTISQLQDKLRELTNKMRVDYTLNTKMVTAIIPGREREGQVSVSVGIVESQAENIVNRYQYAKVLDPATQSQVNNLYAGLQMLSIYHPQEEVEDTQKDASQKELLRKDEILKEGAVVENKAHSYNKSYKNLKKRKSYKKRT